jgi:hypothetical protein
MENVTMNELSIEATQSTPSVEGNWEAGVLKLGGDSFPENSYEFFGSVIDWIERYLAGADRPLTLDLRLMYMNTSSVKAMMDIFDMLEDAHRAGRKVQVLWYHDRHNERVADLAAEFREDCTFPFGIEKDDS